nr:MAG TPA: Pituitary adenylate cyclase activating polypeptide-38-GROWTH FACTOR COMPLEX [Caudoviricetes sp.]DAZ43060.1 MAG TPA: Pituitary adenylate cyclase activating polypeptide-38-GROWTH FACTOR COMPLEX [Caudoviricetes sp.]
MSATDFMAWVLGKNSPCKRVRPPWEMLVVALVAPPCQGQDEQGGAQDAENQTVSREIRR